MIKICLCLALFWISTASAALQFDTTTLKVDVPSDRSFYDITFGFKNVGNQPVAIGKVETSCPCMSPADAIRSYAPGEEGKLTIHYAVGSRVGVFVENIKVQTSDSSDSITLRLIINIPVLFRFDPENAIWQLNSPAKPQEILFMDLSGKGVKPTMVYSTSTAIDAVLTKNAAGETVVRITPKSTANATGAIVYVDVDVGNGLIRKFTVIAAIQDPNAKDSTGKPIIQIGN